MRWIKFYEKSYVGNHRRYVFEYNFSFALDLEMSSEKKMENVP